MTASVARVRPPSPCNRIATASRGAPLHRMLVCLLPALYAARGTTLRPSFGLPINRSRQRRATRTDVVRPDSIGEDRASRHRRPCAHAHADRVCVQESADPARMTGNQPDPPRTGRAEMACRGMPAGRKRDVRAAMSRITAIAACGPRRVTIDHFSTPFAVWCLFRQPDDADAPAIRRRRSVLAVTRSLHRARAPHPRGLHPGRYRKLSLPDRTDLASSTLARPSSQGPGQRCASPAGQGGDRAG